MGQHRLVSSSPSDAAGDRPLDIVEDARRRRLRWLDWTKFCCLWPGTHRKHHHWRLEQRRPFSPPLLLLIVDYFPPPVDQLSRPSLALEFSRETINTLSVSVYHRLEGYKIASLSQYNQCEAINTFMAYI